MPGLSGRGGEMDTGQTPCAVGRSKALDCRRGGGRGQDTGVTVAAGLGRKGAVRVGVTERATCDVRGGGAMF
jgi:hypothetical protein